MIKTESKQEKVEISFFGNEDELIDELCGIIIWALEYLEPEDLALALSSMYEHCETEAKLFAAWSLTEFLFSRYRLSKWNSEESQ